MRPLPSGGMDVIRRKKRSLPRGVAVGVASVALLAVAAVALESLSRLNDVGVSVDRSTIVSDVVQQGNLKRSISAAGTLAPQEVHVVAATQAGIVEAIVVKPGTTVVIGSPIARMSNAELNAAVVGARSSVDMARGQLRSVQAQAQANILAQRSAYGTALAQARVDRLNYQSTQSLRRSGFIAEQTYQLAAIKATESASQAQVARSQVGVSVSEAAANIASAKAQFDGAVAQLAAKETEVDALTVRAATSGIVQSVAIDPGARVEAGTELVRIADERNLKAVLAVPEGQVLDVAIGMLVAIDTGNGTVTGHVSRIEPAAKNGSVAVDVALPQSLPAGARPDLNVDARIEIEMLRDVLSIARPAGAADDTTISLYRIDARTNVAHSVRVQFGRGSSDRIQVLSGLASGDTVIVSDTSAYNGATILRIH
jgi:HlyD family secretion protein